MTDSPRKVILSTGRNRRRNNLSKIPHVIHQVWIGKDKTELPPIKYDKYRESVRNVNKDFEMKLWLGQDIDDLFLDDDLSKYKKVFNTLPYIICKADFARMMIMYKCGGIYMDLDFMGHRSLRELLNRYPQELIFVKEPVENKNGEDKIYNGVIAAVPGSKFILEYIDYMAENMSDGRYLGMDVLSRTGPVALMRYAKNSTFNWESFIIPTRFILPRDTLNNLTKESIDNETDGAYVSTIWCDGTMWITRVVEDMCVIFFSMYGIIMLALIFIVLLCFGWGRRNTL